MEREYIIVIKANPAHQPHPDDIFEVVQKLVAKRAKTFPTTKSGTSVTLIPKKR